MTEPKRPKGKGGIYKQVENVALTTDQIPVLDAVGAWEYSASDAPSYGRSVPIGTLKITTKGCEIIRNYASQGLSMELIAERIGMKPDQFNKCISRQPEVRQTIAAAKAEGEFEIRSCLMNMARRGNVIAAIYLSKAVFGWRDNDPPPAQVQSNVVIQLPASMTVEDLKKLRDAGVTPVQLQEANPPPPTEVETTGEEVE